MWETLEKSKGNCKERGNVSTSTRTPQDAKLGHTRGAENASVAYVLGSCLNVVSLDGILVLWGFGEITGKKKEHSPPS